ncbi:hypothetical protein Q5692_32160 [Microcoleus sp. C2C3]|uniref:hypothetical protein n=1 Tax=unclassified Microcoleus TaxID=2642155 RepID=UPI002FD36949
MSSITAGSIGRRVFQLNIIQSSCVAAYIMSDRSRIIHSRGGFLRLSVFGDYCW